MKKLLLTAVLTGLSGVAAANGWYVQGDVGASKLQAKEEGGKIKDTKPYGRVSVGKDLGNFRYAFDYTYFGTLKNTDNYGTDGYHKAKLNAHSAGISGFYDFHNTTPLTPYVGLRASLNYLSLDTNGETDTVQYSHSHDKTQVGIGGLVGAQYQFTDKLAANAGLEYNYLGKVGPVDTKISQYGANVGLRYNF
ncbi:opacity family porin [Neisseria animalis]|uniref:Autotransporter outer membrane beta-barrel domain-containing protein n=1 Tax=Neisseria animalis TaxID=492 RepID=A0A5P3MUI2_NEIAN|nr:opacity family porin [Neisseria animalis]QEY24411.1 autotransporter outer membrane beta-barrel domain-containing protein [Neisseria animalis]ROW31887.1 autotransporter outer membrane beta-barrel domain-containing protein [Neisseria animalis]VEE07000.1 outer membrane protein [Neisseria animalis]